MAGKGFQQFFSMSRNVRSFRTLRQVEQRFAKSRYRKVAIKNPSDLRDFLYEYSLFVGDVNAIPGVNVGFLNSTRGSFLKVGRVMGDATAIMNTVRKIGDKEFKQGTAVGERFVRRYTGRLTGRALGQISGSGFAGRAARSFVGANLQKEFDKTTRRLMRRDNLSPDPAIKVRGKAKLSKMPDVWTAVDQLTNWSVAEIDKLTPVNTGALRATLRVKQGREKVKGGYLPLNTIRMGSNTVDYAVDNEYGSGKQFEIGTPKRARDWFPAPPAIAIKQRKKAKSMRSVRSKGKNQGKGAMMRRGVVKGMDRFNSTYRGMRVSSKYKDQYLELKKNIRHLGGRA